MLSQQVTMVILERELPEQCFLHGQLGRQFPVEGQILWSHHFNPCILTKFHFVKGTKTDPADRYSRRTSLQHGYVYEQSLFSNALSIAK